MTLVRRSALRYTRALVAVAVWTVASLAAFVAIVAWGDHPPSAVLFIAALVVFLPWFMSFMSVTGYERLSFGFETPAFVRRRVRQFRRVLRPGLETTVTVRLAVDLEARFGTHPNAISMVTDEGTELVATISWYTAHRLELAQPGVVVGTFAPGREAAVVVAGRVLWPLSELRAGGADFVLRETVPKTPWH
jgi:hypothetical protein